MAVAARISHGLASTTLPRLAGEALIGGSESPKRRRLALLRSPDLLGLEDLDRRQFSRWRARAVAALIVAWPALASPDGAGHSWA